MKHPTHNQIAAVAAVAWARSAVCAIGARVKILLCLAVLGACSSCILSPSLVVERTFDPEKAFRLEWVAAEHEQLWLRVRTTGGMDLVAPVEVLANGKRVASGKFSLQSKGMVGSGSHFVLDWVSTPHGARGQARLFSLPEIASGSAMVATIELQPGVGVKVHEAAFQVRKGGSYFGFGSFALWLLPIGALAFILVLGLVLRRSGGYAPGWQLRCTKCGKTGDAAKAGIVRIGAFSIGRRVLGRCSGCGGLRFLALEHETDGARDC